MSLGRIASIVVLAAMVLALAVPSASARSKCPTSKSNRSVRVLNSNSNFLIYERTRTRARFRGHVYICKKKTRFRKRLTSTRRIKDSKRFYEQFRLLGVGGRHIAYTLGVPSWAWRFGVTRGQVAVRNWATGRLIKHHYQSATETGQLEYFLLGPDGRLSWVSTYFRFNPFDPVTRAQRAVQIWKSDTQTKQRGTMKEPSFADKLDDAENIDPLSLTWVINAKTGLDFKAIMWRSENQWKEARLR